MTQLEGVMVVLVMVVLNCGMITIFDWIRRSAIDDTVGGCNGGFNHGGFQTSCVDRISFHYDD